VDRLTLFIEGGAAEEHAHHPAPTARPAHASVTKLQPRHKVEKKAPKLAKASGAEVVPSADDEGFENF